MTKRVLLTAWGCLFIVCAALGFMPEPPGAVCFLFFVPPGILLYRGEAVQLIRNLSALSLGLTLLLLVVNFLSVLTSEFWGTAAYYMLTIVSSPMVASGHWAVSLFLWACLLFAALRRQSI